MTSRNGLLIETSTESGSVAVVRDGALLSELTFASRDPVSGARTEALAPAVAECLAVADVAACDVSFVVCSAGPGGFTSLRSAAALAKGLCSAVGIPLYAVSSLEVLALSAALPKGDFIVAIAAGRNEWYASDVHRGADGNVEVGNCEVVGDEELRRRAERSRAALVGAGLDMDVTPQAGAMILRLAAIEAAGAVDLDSWEPAYGRLAEAQVKWEAAHGRALTV